MSECFNCWAGVGQVKEMCVLDKLLKKREKGIERERQRQRDRQTDRQTETETDRQTEKGCGVGGSLLEVMMPRKLLCLA